MDRLEYTQSSDCTDPPRYARTVPQDKLCFDIHLIPQRSGGPGAFVPNRGHGREFIPVFASAQGFSTSLRDIRILIFAPTYDSRSG